MSARTSIPDFALANPLYAGATVSFFTVSGGVKTATLATLYAAPSGTSALTNPQTLDSDGKFQAPVYIDVAVIGSVSGLTNVDDHDTGIVRNQASFRGDWVTATAYSSGDFIRDGANGDDTNNLYQCVSEHTSGVWATDSADVTKLVLVLDQVSIDATETAAAAAAASAVEAAASADAAAASVGSIKVSPNDTTPDDLETKLLAGDGLALTTQNDGGDETRTVALDPSGLDQVVISADDEILLSDTSDSGSVKIGTVQDILDLVPATVDQIARSHIVALAWQVAVSSNLAAYALLGTYLDVFEDETGVDASASTNEVYEENYYTNIAVPTTSYANALGQGDRTATITVTSANIPWDAGTDSNMVDGATGSSSSDALDCPSTLTLDGDETIEFDFGSNQYVDEATIKASASTGIGGTWYWEGFDGADWQRISVNFDAGAAANTVTTITMLSSGHQNIRLKGVSGSMTNNWLLEVEFKIADISSPLAMTLVSNTVTAAAAPAEIMPVIDIEEFTASTENTDFIVSVTRDGGTTWTAANLTLIGGSASGRGVYAPAAPVDVSGQPSGTDVLIKMVTTAKRLQIHRWAVMADQPLSL